MVNCVQLLEFIPDRLGKNRLGESIAQRSSADSERDVVVNRQAA